MTAIVGGVPWSSACVSMQSGGSGGMTITGVSDAAVREVTFMLDGPSRTGSVPIGKGGVVTVDAANYPVITLGASGTATITTYTSTNIVGTFSFNNDMKTVTNGKFNITSTRAPTSPAPDPMWPYSAYTLRGTVTGQANRPVAGATVYVTVYGGSGGGGTLTTDSAGRYAITLPFDRSYGTHMVKVEVVRPYWAGTPGSIEAVYATDSYMEDSLKSEMVLNFHL